MSKTPAPPLFDEQQPSAVATVDPKPHESKPTTTSKTGTFGQAIDGLRVSVSVTKCRWPDPRKTVQITVGKLVAYGSIWDADSRAKAEATLAAILCDQPEALAYLTRALEEVQL